MNVLKQEIRNPIQKRVTHWLIVLKILLSRSSRIKARTVRYPFLKLRSSRTTPFHRISLISTGLSYILSLKFVLSIHDTLHHIDLLTQLGIHCTNKYWQKFRSYSCSRDGRVYSHHKHKAGATRSRHSIKTHNCFLFSLFYLFFSLPTFVQPRIHYFFF